NAMNLVFENNGTPLKWELKVNGHRQLALLRVLVHPVPGFSPSPKQEVRRIYFIGDLISDEKSGGMNMDDIVKTITDVWKMTDTPNGQIQFHEKAQLLVVSGTDSQIQFVGETLNALHQKSEWARFLRDSKPKPKPDESKK